MDEVYGPRSGMVSAQAWEIGKLKAEVFRLQTALADATERAEANATEVHLLGERVRIECERRDQARRERDAATERAEAAERTVARLRDLLDAIDTMIPSEVTRDGADADEMVADLATAWRAAIVRADALAARLAEVDGEHPA